MKLTSPFSLLRLPSFFFFSVFVAALGGCETSQPGWIFQPFAGAGFDDESETVTAVPEEDGKFVLATTYLPLQDGALDLFLERMEPINAVLDAGPAGLVGYSVAQTLDGNAYRTMSIWVSYESMYAFVLHEAHVAAMNDVTDIADGDDALVFNWTVNAEEVPPSWPDVIARLDQDGRNAY